MRVIPAAVCFALIALIPAAYSQETCADCCTYDYKASSDSCCKYWVCDNGVEKEMTCAPGLHWNEKAKACDWPSSAGCDDGTVVTATPQPTTKPPTVPPTVPTTTTTTTTTPRPTTTTTTTTTPRPTTTTTTTTRPPPTTTTPGGGSPATPPIGGCDCECTPGDYDAIEGETCKYRSCNNGQWITMNCAPGTVWDNARQTCVWPCDACTS